MKKLFLFTIIFTLFAISCDKVQKEETVTSTVTTECSESLGFSYLILKDQIAEERELGIYNPLKDLVSYAKEQEAKGKIVPMLPANAWRFIVCSTVGCSMYGQTWYMCNCCTCQWIINAAGPCPSCGNRGLCSNELICFQM